MLAANAGAFWYLERFTPDWGRYLHWRKWDLLFAEAPNGPVDWLVLGDSSGSLGVVAETLQEELGGSALNLCTTAGGTLLDDLWLLDSYIRRHGPPGNVVLVHTFSVWHKSPNTEAVATAPLLWLLTQGIQPHPFVGLGMANLKPFFMKYFPLYNQSHRLAGLFMPPWEQPWFKNPLAERSTAAGTLALEKAYPEKVARQLGQLLADYKSASKPPAAFNLACLRRLLDLSQRHRLPVYLANGPLAADLLAHAPIQEQIAVIHRGLDALLPQYPLAQRVLHRPLPFATEELVDQVDHLRHPAARLYTQRLAAAIRRAGTAR